MVFIKQHCFKAEDTGDLLKGNAKGINQATVVKNTNNNRSCIKFLLNVFVEPNQFRVCLMWVIFFYFLVKWIHLSGQGLSSLLPIVDISEYLRNRCFFLSPSKVLFKQHYNEKFTFTTTTEGINKTRLALPKKKKKNNF